VSDAATFSFDAELFAAGQFEECADALRAVAASYVARVARRPD
jgi:hypothetical protein